MLVWGHFFKKDFPTAVDDNDNIRDCVEFQKHQQAMFYVFWNM